MNRLPNPIKGYTIVELLIVILIFIALGFISTFYLRSLSNKSTVNADRDELISALESARENSIAVTDGNQYSVIISPPRSYTLMPQNITYELSNATRITQPSSTTTINFDKLTGRVNTEYEIVLESSSVNSMIVVKDSGIIQTK